MLGSKGVSVKSKSTFYGEKYRVDVENPAPGVRPGQVHVQDYSGNKYYYNPNNNKLYINTAEGFVQAPNNIQNLLNDPEINSGIKKGLYYLGE